MFVLYVMRHMHASMRRENVRKMCYGAARSHKRSEDLHFDVRGRLAQGIGSKALQRRAKYFRTYNNIYEI